MIMMNIRKKTVFILLCSLIAFAYNANCCSCKYFSKTDNLDDRILESSKVFSAIAIKIEFVKDSNLLFNIETHLIKTTFVIKKVYKGNITADTIAIYQEDSNCLFPFKLNKQYLVYSNIEKAREFTDQCTPTVELEESKAHLKLLKQMRRERRI